MIRRLVKIPPLPTSKRNDFTSPPRDEIYSVQQNYKKAILTGTENQDGSTINYKNGPIFIPHKDERIQLRLVIISNCVASGHRGADKTKSVFIAAF